MNGAAVEAALEAIGGKWKMPILLRLAQRIWRYGELKRDLGSVTPKMLTQQLRDLERGGLLRRTVYAEVPPRVEYGLTPLGRSALPAIETLGAWGRRYRRRARVAPRHRRRRQSRRRT